MMPAMIHAPCSLPCTGAGCRFSAFRRTGLAACPQCFAKLNCNKHNKSLGVELGVKVAPTFQLYKNNVKVAEMTGAKIDMLKELVATHK